MNKPLLTFELTKTMDTIEIHTDNAGLQQLIISLQKISKSKEHEHLMTQSWGGNELSEEKQGQDTRIINHVKIFLWENK